MTTAIIASAGIDQIEAARAKILDLYRVAAEALKGADDLLRVAAPSGSCLLPALHADRNGFPLRLDQLEEAVRRPLDRSIWSHLIQVTQLDRLMDATAKKQFRDQLDKDPPPATADNCRATIEQLLGDSDLIFKRGVATAFSKLDRRFRSHDGFKIGSRIVISYFADRDGWLSSNRRDILVDVERAFAVLDGQEAPHRDAGIDGALRLARGSGLSARAYEAESSYFRAKVFKNGNAHVYFKRDDLVDKVNLLLADYYGAALGAGADVADKPHEPARTPAKNFGLFETPIALADRVLDDGHVWTDRNKRLQPAEGRPKLRILEPSAGRGRIALRAAGWGHSVTAVEIQSTLALELQNMGVLERVVAGDFLDQSPEALGKFDRILMNPPFDGQRDIDHVTHALRFLAPGGRLVAIMSASTAYRENAKAEAFRAQVERMRGRIEDLPEGSFKESGTMVNTVIVTING